MSGRVCGVDIDLSETSYSFGRSKQACHPYPVSVGSPVGKGVNEVAPYVMKQGSCFRHKKRHRVRQRIHGIKIVASYMYYRTFCEIGGREGGHRVYAQTPGCPELDEVAVVKQFRQSADISDTNPFGSVLVIACRPGRHDMRCGI